MKAQKRPIIDDDVIRLGLSNLGMNSVEDLIDLCSDAAQDKERRVSACYLAGRMGLREMVPALTEIVKQSDAELAWAAGAALGQIRSRRATRFLIDVIKTSTFAASRQSAIYALWGIRDRRAANVLMQVLSNKTQTAMARGLAAEALGMIPLTRQILRALIQALEDTEPGIRYSAICGLGGTGSKLAMEPLRSLVDDQAVIPGTGTIGVLAQKALSQLQEIVAFTDFS